MSAVLKAKNPDLVTLLSHLWSRPVATEVERWHVYAQQIDELPGGQEPEDVLTLPGGDAAVAELLDEYERLFVGPGTVSCPPYESYWREDVSVDVRSSLGGPCTVELTNLYKEAGLELPSSSNELADHVAIELEALAVFLRSPFTLALAEPLVNDHLKKFLPRLCRAVAHDAKVDFYRQLAKVTRTWLTMMVDELAVTASDVTAAPVAASGGVASTSAIDPVNLNAV